MESTQLQSFYQHVTRWSETEAELGAIAEKLLALLGLPFVAIHRVGAEGVTGWRLQSPSSSPDAAAIKEFVVRQIRRAEGTPDGSQAPGFAKLCFLDVENGSFPARARPEVSALVVVSLSSEGRPSLSTMRQSKGRIEHGWIVVGYSGRYSGSLSEDARVLLLAAACWLSALAEAAALEGAIQLRNQFLSIASHELKTPLTSIYGVLQLQERMLRLRKDEPAHGQREGQREGQESYLKMVIRQTQRLNELIDGLLDVSRIQSGRFMTEPSDTDVGAIVRETVSGRLALIAREAGVRLSLDAPEAQRAWVDPVRLEEVVTNLVMNAIRFSPEGGIVWIKLKADEPYLRLIVRDQGPSVPIEDRERIFQPFERAQRTARFGGLGLGLFISRQIAQLHGGNVLLTESMPGKGNSFEATFPLRSDGRLPRGTSASA